MYRIVAIFRTLIFRKMRVFPQDTSERGKSLYFPLVAIPRKPDADNDRQKSGPNRKTVQKPTPVHNEVSTIQGNIPKRGRKFATRVREITLGRK